MKIEFELNGHRVAPEVEARMTLVDCIRHELRQTGTHVGCEHGVCGACMVRLDGVAVRSCLLLAVQADGCRVETVEGLAQDGELNALQTAFRECHALQCGFCTPGMIMAITGFLKDNPSPTDEEIIHGLEGNLCRCTGYVNIIKAVKQAAQQMKS